jgi:DDE_Tnp_1-associated
MLHRLKIPPHAVFCGAQVEEQLQAYRSALPTLLKRLGRIRDPRNPKTIQHQSTVLLLYGILMFAFQMASRREANRRMTMPQFQKNLQLLFPELESMAHQDTLKRLLAGIAVHEIEGALVVWLAPWVAGDDVV